VDVKMSFVVVYLINRFLAEVILGTAAENPFVILQQLLINQNLLQWTLVLS
jgi:hypothetical protein